MNELFSRRHKEEKPYAGPTLESIGVTYEPNSRLNCIGAPVTVWHFRDSNLGTVHAAYINRPFAGEYLITVLNSIKVRYPKDQGKEIVGVADVAADHILPSITGVSPGFRSLHDVHANDPVIGRVYREFAGAHAQSWKNAEEENGLDGVMDVALRIVQTRMFEEHARTNRDYAFWQKFMSEPVTKHPVRLRQATIRATETGAQIEDHRNHSKISIDSGGEPLLYISHGGLDRADVAQLPASWRMGRMDYQMPYEVMGLRPLLMWSENGGQRRFLTQMEAMGLMETTLMRFTRFYRADVFLGRTMLAYLSPQITEHFAWHLPLEGSVIYQRMTAAQMPVWVSIDRYASNLLSDVNPLIGLLESA